MQLKPLTYVFDCEGDSLTPTKIHCLALETSEGSFETVDYGEMRKALLNAKVLIGQNIIRWDVPQLERLLEIKINARLIDTLALSWALFPSRSSHNLEEWGVSFGIPKPEIKDWATLTPEEYLHRCREDVKITSKLWGYCLNKLNKLYTNEDDLNGYIDYLSFKMKCAQLQEKNGWRLDTEYARSALESLTGEQEGKVALLASVMPKVPVLRCMTRPKVFTKKDGSLSKLAQDWLDRLRELGYNEDTEQIDASAKGLTLRDNVVVAIEVLSGYDDPNPNSHDQIKKWLFSLGWEPDFYKQNDKGEEVPQVRKDKASGGGITNSVRRLFEKEPKLEVLDGLSVLNHRIPILRGFLGKAKDGKLKAGISGFTNTLRMIHSEIVNLPASNLPYAEAVRGSLVSDPGCILAGSDMVNIEDRTKQHYLYPHDPEYVHSMDRPDWDSHIDIAIRAELMTEEDGDAYKKGDLSKKSIRQIGKSGNFAAVYGAGPPKLARTMGIPLKQAKKFHKAYHERNWAVKAVANEQVYKTILSNGEEELWLLNPVSHFWYSLRDTKDIFSTLNQGTADYCFFLYVGFVTQEEDHLLGTFHDEAIWQIPDTDEARDKMTKLTRKSIDAVNDFLKLNKQLDISLDYGTRYSLIH